jgi:hypothetical protein
MVSYEFKVRKAGDDRDWEKMPAMGSAGAISPQKAREAARRLANETADCVEVRYNAAGSLQGHYVRPARPSASLSFSNRLANTLGL